MLDNSKRNSFQEFGKHYVGHCVDEKVLENSSSGGMFTAFSRKIFELKGCVFGAIFNEGNCEICHVKAENENELKPLRKSKYVWSDYRKCIPDIKKAISEERYILFTGTPCQAASIRKMFLNYEKLFIVDLFCHGTAEVGFFKDYLKIFNSKISKIDFRGQSLEKTENYNFRLWDTTGLIIDDLYHENIFTSLYTNSAIIRNACFSCPFATKRHLSDITIGDYSFPESSKLMNMNVKHPSIIAVNTDKGNVLLDMCLDMLNIKSLDNSEEIEFYYRDHDTVKGEWGYNKEIKDNFLRDYKKYGFIKAAIYCMYPREMYLIDELKKIMDKDKKILLYGSGCVGRRIFSLIRQIYPEWKLGCFLTSKKTEEDFLTGLPIVPTDSMINTVVEKKYLSGISVSQIDDIDILDDEIVVISVSESYIDEIEEELKKRNIVNYIK